MLHLLSKILLKWQLRITFWHATQPLILEQPIEYGLWQDLAMIQHTDNRILQII